MGRMLLSQGHSHRVAGDCLPPEEPVPIRMAIAEKELPIWAPVITIDASSLSSVGTYVVREGSTAGQYPWAPTPFTLNLTPSGISGSQISSSLKFYYPLGGKRAIFHGYYPRTTATIAIGNNCITTPDNGIAPTYHLTLTDTGDVMYAVDTPTGSTNTSPVSLTSNHVLTQLRLSIFPLGPPSDTRLAGTSNKGMLSISSRTVTYDSPVTDTALIIPLLGSVTDTVMVPASVMSYKVEVVLLLSLLKRTYLVKPAFGAFQPGVIYTISL